MEPDEDNQLAECECCGIELPANELDDGLCEKCWEDIADEDGEFDED